MASNEGKPSFLEDIVRSVVSGAGPLVRAGAMRCIRVEPSEIVVASVRRSLAGCSISVPAKVSVKGLASKGRL